MSTNLAEVVSGTLFHDIHGKICYMYRRKSTMNILLCDGYYIYLIIYWYQITFLRYGKSLKL